MNRKRIWYLRKPGRLCWLQHDYILLLPPPELRSEPGEEDAWVSLANQCLQIRAGFAWDGAWPLPRWRCLLRASLVHDALYHLMRKDGMPWHLRRYADAQLRKIAIEDGAPAWLAAACYYAVRLFGRWRRTQVLHHD